MNSQLNAEDKDKIGFYILHNNNTDELYIGSGILGNRQKRHEYLLKNNRHWNYKLQEAYNRDPNFDFVGAVIDEGDEDTNRVLALQVEQSMIDEFKTSPLMLNLAHNVEAPMAGFKHRAETIDLFKQRANERWQDPDYREKAVAAQKEGWAKLSDEEKKKLGEQRSEKLREIYKNGRRISNAGQTRSQDFCEQNSSKIKQKWQDPLYRETQMAARVGKMIGPNRMAVIIDGVEYESMQAAAKVLGMTAEGLGYRIKSPNFPTWNKK